MIAIAVKRIVNVLRPATITLPASALIVLLCSTGAFALSQTKQDIDELQRNFFVLQSEVADIKATVEKLPSGEVVNQIRQSQAELLTQLQDLLREVQVLTGRFEESKYYTDKILTDTSAQMEVLNTKVDASAGGLNKKDAEVLIAKVEAIEASLKTMDERLAALEKAAKISPPDEDKKPAAKQKTPDDVYDEALAVFKKSDFGQARKMMESFIKDYPDNKLAGNAQFWVAESYYAEKDYPGAILAYEDLLQKYKGHAKIPAALLKQALAFMEMGDDKAAKGILRELVANHPDSDQAQTAKEKLKALEGKESKSAPESAGGASKPSKPAASKAN